jgi:hypothetical protein
MALAAGSIGRLLARRPRLGPWLDRLCGVLFIGLALRWRDERTQATTQPPYDPPAPTTTTMRRSPSGPPPPASGERHDWQTIKKLLPYLWAWKWRVMFALGCLISPSSPTSRCR